MKFASSRGTHRACDSPKCNKMLVSGNRLVCSACKSAVYCNKICQKDGWPVHKVHCKIFTFDKTILNRIHEERKLMHTILETVSPLIYPMHQTYIVQKKLKGGFFVNANQVVNDSGDGGITNIHVDFISFKDIKNKDLCEESQLSYLKERFSEQKIVFGLIADGKIAQFTSFVGLEV